MKNVKMTTPNGQLMTRIPESDVAYHEKNGWTLVSEKNTSSVKKEVKTKSVTKIESIVETDLTPNEGEE